MIKKVKLKKKDSTFKKLIFFLTDKEQIFAFYPYF